MKIPGWNCRDGTPEEDHDWKLKHDSYGDAGVINGTEQIFWLECEQCGKEKECDNPSDWISEDDYL